MEICGICYTCKSLCIRKRKVQWIINNNCKYYHKLDLLLSNIISFFTVCDYLSARKSIWSHACLNVRYTELFIRYIFGRVYISLQKFRPESRTELTACCLSSCHVEDPGPNNWKCGIRLQKCEIVQWVETVQKQHDKRK